MENNKIGKIAVAKAGHPRSRFNLAHDVNTTASFGDLQPLMCQFMVPDSKATLDVESLVRAAPMVAPSFGRIDYEHWSMFVPLDEVFPNYDAMMARQKIGRSGSSGSVEFMPSQLPTITPKKLAIALLLPGATCGAWVSESSSTYEPAKLSEIISWLQYIKDDSTLGGNFKAKLEQYFDNKNLPEFDFTGGTFNAGWLFGEEFAEPEAPFITDLNLELPIGTDPSDFDNENARLDIDTSDLVIMSNLISGLDSHPRSIALCFRLSSFGSRMYKILTGLGYPISLEDDTTEVSLLPLFAWYRAYFELFGLELYENFEQSACSKLIQQITNNNLLGFVGNGSGNPYFDTTSILWDFFRELGNCFVTDTVDYVSQHIETAGMTNVDESGNGLAQDILGFVNGGKFIDTTLSPNLFAMALATTRQEGALHYNGVNHGALDEQIMKIFYRWTNRQTVDGASLAKNLSDLGLGHYMDEIKVEYIGHFRKSLNISDIAATADTFQSVNGEQTGSHLGEFAGKSVTYDRSNTISWETKKAGYWVTLGAIVPHSGYCQAFDSTVKAVKPFDIYTPELDSRGYEATTKSELFGHGNIFSRKEDNGDPRTTFGLRPRYMNFKVTRNIANGDFSLHSRRSTYLPFMLDKILPINERRFQVIENGARHNKAVLARQLTFESTPIAGNIWRYAYRYGFMGNLNRIFKNNGFLPPVLTAFGESLLDNTLWIYCDTTRDNFIVHNIFNLQYYAPMLPTGASYGTADDEAKANFAQEKS